MKPRLFVEPEAEADIAEAFAWYEAQRPGLGTEFKAALVDLLQTIEDAPERVPVIRGRTRRALLRRFPFGVFYVLDPELIAVTACLHGRRNPRRWQIRRR
jgi:plasmid stabilization system protein ParE